MSGHRQLKNLFLVALLCGAFGTSIAADVDPGRPKKSTTGAVLRSLAVPGWGQVYTENYWRAGIYAVTQGSFFAGIWWNHNQMKGAAHAENGVDERFYRNQRNRMVWWFLGATLLSMGDSYVNAHLYGLDWSPAITYDERGATAGLTAAVRF